MAKDKKSNEEAFNLQKGYNFTKIESDVTEFWKKHRKEIITDSITYNPKKELYSFLEGPPTANAPPGLHHVEMRVFKDLYCRFKHMQGYTVPRKGGWDCHGLPVEVQVEKKLGLKHKQEVIEYGESKFIAECKKDVFTFVKDWTDMSERMAFWADLEKPYMTLNTNFMESVWWSLKELFNKDLLYEGHKVVPYCPRCETPLSSHEVAQGYEDVTEPSVTAKFKLKNDKDNRVVLAWTTTPWTLISNLALAVNPKLKYATFTIEDEKTKDGVKYIMAEDLIGSHFKKYNVLETFLGKDIAGKEYEPLYDYAKEEVEAQKSEGKTAWKIILADYVTVEDGTGVVHQAPAFGEDDYNTCKENNIAYVNLVNKNGTYLPVVEMFKGRFVKDCDEDIIKDLKTRGILFKKQAYTHSYPFCWRCKSPLLYYAMDSWFIAVSKYQNRMSEINQDINWAPNHIKDGRFGNWIAGAKDWAVSRNKFWGTPLPIWKCDCGHVDAIGSIAELEERSGVKVDDLHKDTVDKLKVRCTQCDKTMTRTPEVIDCWYDSGSASFAQYHYPFENKEMFDKSFPYSFIAEAIDQTRGWFYTMHVLGTLLFDKMAYKSVGVGGHLCDEKGEKMSKSKGNIIKPNEVFDKFGVDASRLLFCQYGLGASIRFGEGPLNEGIMPFFNTLWNSFYFGRAYMDAQNIDGLKKPAKMNLEDKWMVKKTDIVIQKYTDLLEKHNENHCLALIQNFVTEDLSRWYIKLIRDRAAYKDEALAYTFRYVFDAVSKLLAPLAPYVSEYIYQESVRTEKSPISVHLADWPKVKSVDESADESMSLARDVVQGILSARDKASIGVRWPLAKAIISAPDMNKESKDKLKLMLKNLDSLIMAQTNVRDIIIEEIDVDIKVSPDYRALGKEFGEHTATIISHIKGKEDILANLFKSNKDYSFTAESKTVDVIKGEVTEEKEFVLSKNQFKIEKLVPEEYSYGEIKNAVIYVEKALTPELEAEGFAREVVRRVQALRKDAGLEKSDDIDLYVQFNPDMHESVGKNVEGMKKKIGAKKLTFSTQASSTDFEFSQEFKVKGKEFVISFNIL